MSIHNSRKLSNVGAAAIAPASSYSQQQTMQTSGKADSRGVADVSFLQSDLTSIAQKYAELSGEPYVAPSTRPPKHIGAQQQPATSSSFHNSNGLRNSVPGPDGGSFPRSQYRRSASGMDQCTEINEDKVCLYQDVLRKLTQLERLVLDKTAPESGAGRRNSRAINIVTIPTHMQILDRLMDLHRVNRRLSLSSASPEQSSSSSSASSSKNGVIARKSSVTSTSAPSSASTAKSGDSEHSSVLTVAGSALDTSQTEIARLKAEIASQKRTIDSLNSKVASLTNGISEKDVAYEALRAKHAAQCLDIERCKKENAAMNAENKRLEEDNKKLAERLQAAADALSALEKSMGANAIGDGEEVARLKAQLSAAETKASEQETRIGELTKLNNQNEIEIKSMRKENIRYYSEHKTMSAELRDAKFECEGLKKKVNRHGTEMAELRREQMAYNAHLEDRLQKMTTQYEYLQESFTKLTSRLQEMEALPDELKSLEARYAAAERDKCHLLEEVQVKDAEIEQLQRMRDYLALKLRECATLDTRAFADSLEDAVGQEMMSMKGKFTEKVRSSQSTADQRAADQQREIDRLKSSGSDKREVRCDQPEIVIRNVF